MSYSIEIDVDDNTKLIAKPSNIDLDNEYRVLDSIKEYPTLFCVYLSSDMNDNIATFSFQMFPRCPAIVCSLDTFSEVRLRGTNVSAAFRKLKNKVAKDLGFNTMIATANSGDVAAFKNMQKSGYQIVDSFNNRYTNHNVVIGIKSL
jgi:hypothetical protein